MPYQDLWWSWSPPSRYFKALWRPILQNFLQDSLDYFPWKLTENWLLIRIVFWHTVILPCFVFSIIYCTYDRNCFGSDIQSQNCYEIRIYP